LWTSLNEFALHNMQHDVSTLLHGAQNRTENCSNLQKAAWKNEMQVLERCQSAHWEPATLSDVLFP